MTPIGELVLDALRAHPHRVAFVHAGTALSYRDTEERVLGLVELLAKLPPGDTVVQIRRNDPLQWLVNAACYVAGCRSAAIPPGTLSEAGIAERLDLIGAATVLTDVDIPAPGGPVAVASADTVVRLAFTSGTTGPVKGVELSSGALGAVAIMLRDTLPWPDHPRVLCPEPVSGGFGNMVAPTLSLGGTFIIPERSDVDSVLDAVIEYHPTVLMMMPPVLRAVLNHPRSGGVDWSDVTLVIYSGASLTSDEVDRAHVLFGEVLCQVFGQVEVPKTIAWSSPADHGGDRRSSLGRPFPGTEIRISGPDGTPLPAGHAGELWVRGPNTASSYAFPPGSPVHDGWLRTGDVCRFDDDGYLHYVDRVQHVLRVGGAYVCPADIEAEILARTGRPIGVLAAGPETVRFVPGGLPRDVMGRIDRRRPE
ncbi:class I adenylate-forming enzyme family protein [Amycolatopsis sp. EV170708-02-1]|uniref:class I adenylate-forming enzyme family protein n=1 Tax=Amycolatopsis sp. EV170708-02-1 TaxID=2919322 RepID=UPI001F0C054C|nr:AMP-binding protein [Amycolatopsis sp. EV170708-02-1]UMP06887.1 AMP-binding protein [Amycolatopsis sp. EV170708-02-1]